MRAIGIGVATALFWTPAVPAATAPGTVIENTAFVAYLGVTGLAGTEASNKVDVTTVVRRTDASIGFVKTGGAGAATSLSPSQCVTGGGPVALPGPVAADGSPIDLSTPQPLASADSFHVGEALFVRVDDADQDLDPAAVDRVDVELTSPTTGDREVVALAETGMNTGSFAGYLPTALGSAAPGDCVLQLAADARVDAKYVDPADPQDVVAAQALVDPLGVVFDARTGAPVDGAVVRLVDVSTGQAADVVGDDGTSAFPAEIVSGGTATDASGTVYNFAPGAFRFPLIAPGTYRFEITPPTGYSAPSVATAGELQALPGAPFAISAGSYGSPFAVDPGPVVNIDIPLDPRSTALFVRKTASQAIAGVGDFVRYQVVTENADASSPVQSVTLTDTLPQGFRIIPGSIRIDGSPAPDPTISDDGQVATFLLGDLAPSASREIAYVVEVTSGARGPDAVNAAVATGGAGARSNTATATIRLGEDLFASRSILVGRVIDGSCDDDVANDLDGVENARVYLEDGRYALTDEGGRFHFEGLEPGSHVVQLDLDALPDGYEVVPCENNARFAGRAYSQFVDLRAGALWRADFHVRPIPPPSGAVSLSLSSAVTGDDEVAYTLSLQGSGVPVERVEAMVMLPDGVSYLPGTTVVDGVAHTDPAVAGAVLRFPVGDRSGDWTQEIGFLATVATAPGNYATKALAAFRGADRKTERTPLAENNLLREPAAARQFRDTLTPGFDSRSAQVGPADRADIERRAAAWRGATEIHVRAVGHTDARRIAPENRHEFSDNYVLARARAEAVGQVIRESLGMTPAQIVVEGAGPDRPVADNETSTGRARNRRVELEVWGFMPGSGGAARATVADSGPVRADVTAAAPRRRADPVAEPTTDEKYLDEDWVQALSSPEPAMLLPEPDYNPPIPTLKIAISHGFGQRVELALNGVPVSPLNFEGVTHNGAKTISLSRWRGVDLESGVNRVSAIVRDRDGNEIARLDREINFAEGPVRATLDRDESMLVADGRTQPVLALRMYDGWSKPARPETVGIYRVQPPYRAQWEIDRLTENQLLAVGDREPVYSVGPDGIARIALEPTTRSGEVVVVLKFRDNREQQIRAWLEPAARDWILVGLAEGTVGFNSISTTPAAADRAGVDEDLYTDGRVAFFAKGRVKGDFLLTAALDTARDRDEARRRLDGTIDPDRFYTLYGDATEQNFEAPSQEKFYVKIERREFYALFGDYETGLTVTELARYNRGFNGLKTEYNGGRLRVTGFAARTDQAFVKDELRGDGTSGLYRLGRDPIVINSEKVTLETRDRFRSDEIIESRPLTRHLDYDIDYLAGTLFFKQPVPSRDAALNPVFIVVDYETRGAGDRATTGGGRIALNLADDRVEVGATAIRENTAGADGDLVGADLKVRLTGATELRAEYATSEQGVRDGTAWLAELSHRGGRLDGKVYAREHETGFGLGQQNAAENGTRKMGFDGRLRLSKRLTLNTQAYRQENIASDIERDVVEAELRYSNQGRTVNVGVRDASDRQADGQRFESRQVFAGASTQVFGDRVTLRANTDMTLSGSDENVDYPRRTVLGLDYKLSDTATMFAEHELADGEGLEAQTTRVGMRATPWERAQLQTAVNQQMTEYGPRTFANLGLTQGWMVNERWALDLGVDHTNTIRAPGTEPFDDDVPLASGNAERDFTSVFAGALYRTENWTANARVESRRSDEEKRVGLYAGLYREQLAGHGFSARADVIDSQRDDGNDVFSADIRVGWSFRPADSAWIVFDRLDLKYEDVGGANPFETWRVINNVNANWMINRRTQFGVQYGAKFVRSLVADDTYSGFTDLLGLDLRRDLNARWDFGLAASVLHSWGADTLDYSLGADFGWAFTRNVWLSLGYNIAGFDDEDFRSSRYTAHGPYIRFRFKADQQLLRRDPD